MQNTAISKMPNIIPAVASGEKLSTSGWNNWYTIKVLSPCELSNLPCNTFMTTPKARDDTPKCKAKSKIQPKLQTISKITDITARATKRFAVLFESSTIIKSEEMPDVFSTVFIINERT